MLSVSAPCNKRSPAASVTAAPPVPASPSREEAARVCITADISSPLTPRLQLLQAASAPPPVLQCRKFTSAPHPTHPVLAAAFSRTGKADAPGSHPAQPRPPARRQLDAVFARAASLPDPCTLFAFAPHAAKAQILSDQLTSLPSPEKALQQVLAKDAAQQCLREPTPSGLLTTLLEQANLGAAGIPELCFMQG